LVWKEIDHSEDLSIDERIILKHLREDGFGVVDWIHLSWEGDQWLAFFGNVPSSSIKCGEFLD
jgi:hypothetical protein